MRLTTLEEKRFDNLLAMKLPALTYPLKLKIFQVKILQHKSKRKKMNIKRSSDAANSIRVLINLQIATTCALVNFYPILKQSKTKD